jgi:hypothetical protein
LIYVRARYYEPSTGRFISEDPARDGLNWFIYAANLPSSKNDPDGQVATLAANGLVIGSYLYFIVQFLRTSDPASVKKMLGLIVSTVMTAYALNKAEAIRALGAEAHDLACIQVHGKRPKFETHLKKIVAGSPVVAFYVGYQMALMTIMEYLDI